MTPRRAVRWLLAGVLGLPLGQAVLLGTAGLLAAMGDEAVARLVRQVATGIGVAWLVSLVGLIVAMAFAMLGEPPPKSGE